MRELNILRIVFFTALGGSLIGFGGSVYAVMKEKNIRQEATLPETQIAVPSLSQ